MKSAGIVLLIICIGIFIYAICFMFSKSIVVPSLGIAGAIAYIIWLFKKSDLF